MLQSFVLIQVFMSYYVIMQQVKVCERDHDRNSSMNAKDAEYLVCWTWNPYLPTVLPIGTLQQNSYVSETSLTYNPGYKNRNPLATCVWLQRPLQVQSEYNCVINVRVIFKQTGSTAHTNFISSEGETGLEHFLVFL